VALNIEMRLCLPRDRGTVPFVRHICRHVLVELSVTVDCQAAVLLALTEACDNVVLHAAGDDEYEVHLEITDEECQIRIIDAGKGFDPFIAEQLVGEATDEAGRGIMLMRALVDTLNFDSRPEAGTVVRLVKQLEFDGHPPFLNGPGVVDGPPPSPSERSGPTGRSDAEHG